MKANEMTDVGAENLRTAIIRQAIDDSNRVGLHTDKSERKYVTKEKLDKFFRSSWFEMLAGDLDGKALADRALADELEALIESYEEILLPDRPCTIVFVKAKNKEKCAVRHSAEDDLRESVKVLLSEYVLHLKKRLQAYRDLRSGEYDE